MQNTMAEWNAGCSALSWTTEDGKHLWGRNFDFNRIAAQTQVTYVPRGTTYYACGTTLEQNALPQSKCQSAYAAVGTGLILAPQTPLLYEGVNEKGLMGGQLYYRGFSRFSSAVRPGAMPLQPPLAVYHLLAQCATVSEVAHMLTKEATLVAIPMLGSVPTLHWAFTDRSGESIVIEPDVNGLHIYRNTIGVMTNSPGYPWHRTNLLCYAGLRDADVGALTVEGDTLEPCFSGSGAQGLPGDFSSPSRFIRLAFLKRYAVRGENEVQGVSRMLRLFESAAFPLGAVRVGDTGDITAHDAGVVPYDYTLYTSVMCAESLRFYFTSYENPRIRCVDLQKLMDEHADVVQYPLLTETDIAYL